MSKMGRPKLAMERKRSDLLSIRLLPGERHILEEEAAHAGKDGVSVWAREVLLATARARASKRAETGGVEPLAKV